MRKNPIAAIWLAGILLSLALYAVGPDRFIAVVERSLLDAQFALFEAVATISGEAYALIRALAIGLFVTFLALCAVAERRGVPVRRALVVVAVVFLLIVSGPGRGAYLSSARWLAALVVAGAGAASVTRRALHAPPDMRF